jgi:predicted phage terminase large subunit-like protein
VYAGQYQQNPAPIEGNIIKRSEIRYCGGIDPRTGQPDEKLPESFDRTILSVDCAFKDAATSDFVAIAVIGIKGRKRYILNVVNKHLDAAATEAEIRRQRDVHRPVCATVIEGKANGPAVIQRLKVNVPGVQEVNPQGGKTARMFAAAPEWQAGDWYVDRNGSLNRSQCSPMPSTTTWPMQCRK